MLVHAGDPDEPPVELLHAIARRIAAHCGYGLLKAHRVAWAMTVDQAVAAVHRVCREQNLGTRGLTDRSWKHWEAGERPSADYQDIVSRLFCSNPVGLGFTADYTPARANDDDPTPVPCGRAPGSSLSKATTSPPATATGSNPPYPAGGMFDVVERWITMAAHESAHLGDQPSNLGPLTLDRLRADAQALARRFANAPRLSLFHSARQLRDQVFTLLDGRQRMAESRDLYFLAAVSLGMLAEATDDLGFGSQAMTHARTGLLCAREAGHPALIAWLMGSQSLISYWDGRPGQAVEYARRGQEVATGGTVTVWLPALEARAAARRGDSATATEALERASAARDEEHDDELDTNYGGILTFSSVKETYYAGGTWMALGDGARARPAAQAAIRGYQQGSPEDRARDNETFSHITIATAHALDDDMEAAQDALAPALELPPELRTTGLGEHLRHLHARVSQPRYQGSAPASAIRDRIEDYLATATPALPAD